MTKYILSCQSSFPSCRLLRNALQEIIGERILISADPKKIRSPIVRYGNSTGDFKVDTDLNSKMFINICSSKFLFSRLMEDNKIFSPIYLRNRMPDAFPVIIRTTLTSYGGRGIIVCRDLNEFKNNWNKDYYWTPYIFTMFELRAHILGGNVVKIFRKIPNEAETNYPIRNNASCHFGIVEIEKYPKLTSVIEQFKYIFGENNFYAMDVGWDADTHRYFVYEINSAPGLNENSAQDYAEFISEKL